MILQARFARFLRCFHALWGGRGMCDAIVGK